MVFETVEISSSVEERREESPLVSWAAIVAGAIAAAALTLVLLAFGAGMGFSAVSPWSNSGVSASTFQIGTGIYLIVVAMLASTVGGFIAGRLRTKWVGVHEHEVFFRDTAHGFLAWGLATVLGAAFLASAASNIAGVRIICTGIRRSGGLLRGCAIAIQSCRKPKYDRYGSHSP